MIISKFDRRITSNIACKIACLGGAIIDRVCTSASGEGVQPGGVALNMAGHFRALGREVGFFGAIGRDGGGALLKAHLDCQGITSHLLERDDPTAEVFLAYDAQGSGGQILCQTAITDRLEASDLNHWELSPYDIWVVDTDFPQGLIEAIASQKPPETRLFATVVSREKAHHLPPNLSPFDGIFMNESELGVLSPHGKTMEERIAPLLERGCRLLFVTQGASGAWMVTPDQITFESAKVLRTTTTHGAGDAFAAHIIHFLQEGDHSPVLRGLQGAHQHLKRINAC